VCVSCSMVEKDTTSRQVDFTNFNWFDQFKMGKMSNCRRHSVLLACKFHAILTCRKAVYVNRKKELNFEFQNKPINQYNRERKREILREKRESIYILHSQKIIKRVCLVKRNLVAV